jgi:hypothetical protein
MASGESKTVLLYEEIDSLQQKLKAAEKKIASLKLENHHLRTILRSRSDMTPPVTSLKRPYSALDTETTSSKRLKLTPASALVPSHSKLDKSKSGLKETTHKRSEARLTVMREIVRTFNNECRPRYQEHLNAEHSSRPKLREKDGRPNLHNIRYLR